MRIMCCFSGGGGGGGGLYEEDEGTGRTWLQCTCSR